MAKEERNGKKVVCPECGSSDVKAKGWAEDSEGICLEVFGCNSCNNIWRLGE